jgi:uncharacterized membrane protein HdeD (DUF308 family)
MRLAKLCYTNDGQKLWIPWEGKLEDFSAISGLFALRGVCAVLFGLFALIALEDSPPNLLSAFASYLLINGLLLAIATFYFATSLQHWRAIALEAVVDLVLATFLFLDPDVGLQTALVIAGVWAIFSGALLLVVALYCDEHDWLFAVATSMATLVAALMLISPSGVTALAAWLGSFSILLGVSLMALVWRLWRAKGHPTPPEANLPN